MELKHPSHLIPSLQRHTLATNLTHHWGCWSWSPGPGCQAFPLQSSSFSRMWVFFSWTRNLMVPSQIHFLCATNGTLMWVVWLFLTCIHLYPTWSPVYLGDFLFPLWCLLPACHSDVSAGRGDHYTKPRDWLTSSPFPGDNNTSEVGSISPPGQSLQPCAVQCGSICWPSVIYTEWVKIKESYSSVPHRIPWWGIIIF